MIDLETIDIHELLPQQEPFVMVGKLIRFDDETAATATEVKDGNIFTDSGVFTAAGLIENVAQTCAARIGYFNKFVLKRGIQLGFIGSIRNFKIARLPKVGETLITTITTEAEVFGMTLVNAVVKSGENVIAEAEMKIALREVNS